MVDIVIQEVTSKGCSMCAKAQKVLEENIKPRFPSITIEYIDAESEKGQGMLQEFGIMILPGIIINGEMLSFGGMNEADVVQKIESLQ